MEVVSEGVDETQAVLLEGMEGAQYITIQRADPESLGKGVPLFTLNGELISDGMVVDMINGVGADYSTGTQFYETDDVLPHVLTEVKFTLTLLCLAIETIMNFCYDNQVSYLLYHFPFLRRIEGWQLLLLPFSYSSNKSNIKFRFMQIMRQLLCKTCRLII